MMRKFRVKIDQDALSDIQEITSWYEGKSNGLRKRFRCNVINQIHDLSFNPLIFAIRYKEIRCVKVNKFPYLIHYYANRDNSTIEVLAVFSISRNPKVWEERTK